MTTRDDDLQAALLGVARDPRPAAKAPARRRRYQGGVIRGESVDAAFTVLLYFVLALLVLASWFGTFYGIRGEPAPLASTWRMAADALADRARFLQGGAVQAFLMIVQWGARRRARQNPAYWFLWLAGLLPSVYYNLGSYWAPMLALGVPTVLAALIIVGGDVVPEVFGQRED